MCACLWSRGNTICHGTAYSVKTPLWFELSPTKLFTSMPITDLGWRLHSKWRTTRPKRHAIVPNSKPITQSSDPRDLDPGKRRAQAYKTGLWRRQIEQLGQPGTRTRLSQSFDDIKPERLRRAAATVGCSMKNIRHRNRRVYSSYLS